MLTANKTLWKSVYKFFLRVICVSYRNYDGIIIVTLAGGNIVDSSKINLFYYSCDFCKLLCIIKIDHGFTRVTIVTTIYACLAIVTIA